MEEPPGEYFDYNDVIAAGMLPPTGIRIAIEVKRASDLDRTVFKSDCASVSIPLAQIEHPAGTARYCSLYDLLIEMKDGIETALSMMGRGVQRQADVVIEKLRSYIQLEESFTVIIDDPLGISSVSGSRERVTETRFERTWENDEELGVTRDAPENQLTDVEDVIKILADRKNVVIFTGAGISTESGIPAFRNAPTTVTPPTADTDGATEDTSMKPIWQRFNADEMTITNLLADVDIRGRYWTMHNQVHKLAATATPNPSHNLAGVLHKQGRLAAVITQNIDSLHQRGGVPAEKVFELHGTNTIGRCHGCRAQVPWEESMQQFETRGDVVCPTCNGIVLPDTIAFGAPLDPAVIAGARAVTETADCVIVMGTGLLVAPANQIPTIALQKNFPLIIINKGETKLDEWATVLVDSLCGEACAKIIEAIDR